MNDHHLRQLKQAALDLAEPLELPALAQVLATRAADLLAAAYTAVDVVDLRTQCIDVHAWDALSQ